MINTLKITTTISVIGQTWREADIAKQKGWPLYSSSCPHEDRGPSDLHGFFSPPHHLSLKTAVSLPCFVESDCKIRTIWAFQWQFGRDYELAHSFSTHCDRLLVHRACQAKNSISSTLLAARAPRHALGPDKQILSFGSCMWRSQMRAEAGLSHAFRVDCSRGNVILDPEVVLNVFLILQLSVDRSSSTLMTQFCNVALGVIPGNSAYSLFLYPMD